MPGSRNSISSAAVAPGARIEFSLPVMLHRQWMFVTAIGTVFLADRITKYMVSEGGFSFKFGFINFQATYASGLIDILPLPPFAALFLVMMSLLIATIGWLAVTNDCYRISLLAIIAGGSSNIIDRIGYGAVLDVVTVGSATLNLADGLLLAGLSGFIITFFHTSTKTPDGVGD